MSNKLLLPNKYKKIGWIILIPALIAGVLEIVTDYEPSWLDCKMLSIFPSGFSQHKQFFRFAEVNLTNTLIGTLFIIGALLVGFTKEKNEDEFIEKMRLSSLLWAVFVNYLVLLVAFIFIYELAFLNVMVYNMFTVLLIFIIRFNYILFRNAKEVLHEK